MSGYDGYEYGRFYTHYDPATGIFTRIPIAQPHVGTSAQATPTAPAMPRPQAFPAPQAMPSAQPAANFYGAQATFPPIHSPFAPRTAGLNAAINTAMTPNQNQVTYGGWRVNTNPASGNLMAPFHGHRNANDPQPDGDSADDDRVGGDEDVEMYGGEQDEDEELVEHEGGEEDEREEEVEDQSEQEEEEGDTTTSSRGRLSAAEVARRHRVGEARRRARINAAYDQLRTMVPSMARLKKSDQVAAVAEFCVIIDRANKNLEQTLAREEAENDGDGDGDGEDGGDGDDHGDGDGVDNGDD